MKRLILAAAALLVGTSAAAANLTFEGTFAADDDVLTFAFLIDSPTTVSVISSSWQTPDEGGFDPILTIASADGTILAQQDDGGQIGTINVNGVDYDYGLWDSFFDVDLDAGSYFAVVTQFDNFAVGGNLSDGFLNDGNPNFTFDFNFGGATQPMFNGVWDGNDPRTNFWRFHLLNVTEANVVTEVPAPGTGVLLLLGFGVLGLCAARRRREQIAAVAAIS